MHITCPSCSGVRPGASRGWEGAVQCILSCPFPWDRRPGHSWLRVGNAGIHVISLQWILTQGQTLGWVQGREECACLACAHGEMDAGEKLGEAG